ncbi:MAG: PhzF family phenazine biosynthesis protein [Gammaproteobacteria bacterium]|jgi:PhzF family phenazine biosynthesis protein|nr:PhzF family phenazine biosynthesis protein [Gammaproteobacteria bacterium]MBU1624645.1 PhzF family phenazine biosynthesis protein [Gammaproteobacteria bacterium]MBU1982489.1 PhzF family phenazine biosynthesis protein [Gammaproteobacteria bacterium]
MKLRQYQVDAFTSTLFSGNPAAVCPLDEWLEDALLQSIAAENNLSETAFFVKVKDGFELRWFTPVAEVALCGHATLATAHVIFEHLGYSEAAISFQTKSGELSVERAGGLLEMDFPSTPPVACTVPKALLVGLGLHSAEVFAADDYFVVLDSEDSVRAIAPDQSKLAELDLRGVIVTARGKNTDFVSRFFAPNLGIPEDPVTGSAHCALTPYWAKKLGKNVLSARQISARGGDLQCVLNGNRVRLAGNAVTFMQAEIYI